MNLRDADILRSATNQIAVDDGRIAALKHHCSIAMMLAVDEMLSLAQRHSCACYLTTTQALIPFSFRMYQRSFVPTFADCSHPKHYPRAV
jgi:hypothetical protein